MSGKKSSHTGLKTVLIVLMVLMIAATAFLIKLCIDLPGKRPDQSQDSSSVQLPLFPQKENPAEESSQPEESTLPPIVPVSTATIGSQGDLLMHRPIITACATGEGYDFSSIFRYVSQDTAGFDYFVANLETTLGGPDFPYQGNPAFNCPDAIADAVKDAGYDMLLTANNHSNDTLTAGIDRTLAQVRGVGLETLGTRLSEMEPGYAVVDINGIQVGMVCYTYAVSATAEGQPNLNFNTPVENPGQINFFTYSNINKLYSSAQQALQDMKDQGAEASILYIHWGTEYELTENHTQQVIAQKMCDLGYDVIIGGHPHVVQPVSLLTSATDPAHKTLCIYSLGNAVSNQRREEMRLKTGHTEDGAIFSVTFEKRSDGEVRLSDAQVLPTWVNLTTVDGKREYQILPLHSDTRESWKDSFALSDAQYAEAQNSYERTMAIVGPGMEDFRAHLSGTEDAAP